MFPFSKPLKPFVKSYRGLRVPCRLSMTLLLLGSVNFGLEICLRMFKRFAAPGYDLRPSDTMQSLFLPADCTAFSKIRYASSVPLPIVISDTSWNLVFLSRTFHK